MHSRPRRSQAPTRITPLAICTMPLCAANSPSGASRSKLCLKADAETYHIHPFDLTKVWPHKDYPLIEVGVMELNRNPKNYFNEVEQAAFSPVNIVPGMGYSPDKMLQARLISYPDAHRY